MLVGAPGYRELVTALYMGDDEHIASDTVFGVSAALVVSLKADDAGSPIPGLPTIRFDFSLGRAADNDTGRVGADPAQIVRAAE